MNNPTDHSSSYTYPETRKKKYRYMYIYLSGHFKNIPYSSSSNPVSSKKE